MDYSGKKSVEDIDVCGKRVLLRCDFNVPFDAAGKIADTTRIDASLRTIRYLIKNRATVIIVSHRGRPKGVCRPELSLEPVAAYLSRALNLDIKFVRGDIRDGAPESLNQLKNGDIALLENIRFYKEEEQNDREFAKKLASLAQIYVNDAFGTSHRAHASIVGVAAILPAVCGFLMKKELDILCRALTAPERPFVGIFGGAKISDKIDVINNLLEKLDVLVIAGGMAYTFLNALGYSIGQSIFEADKIGVATDIMTKAKDLGVRIVLPIDNVVGREFTADTDFEVVGSDSIPDGWFGLDIGPKTEQVFRDIIAGARTIFWNGPVGVFEWAHFRHGTFNVAAAIAANRGSMSIVGGGDTAAAVQRGDFANSMTYVSTGGGASLALFEGKDLPGVAALADNG